jgi:tRNA (cmo5U34)-methyltransferase
MTSDAFQNWNQPEYAREYREESDFYIPHRATLLHLVGSYASAFLGSIPRPRLMDLGCGDGAVAQALHRALPVAQITAADGSADMIGAARKRLAGMPMAFQKVSFEEIIAGGLSALRFDGIFSSLAIHHLPLEGKAALFKALRPLLNPGGYFLNVDAVTADVPEYSEWYFTLWREWIEENQRTQHLEQSFGHIPDRARANEENHYDPLGAQLAALKDAGFSDVECHYRFGIFAAYSGRVQP